MEYFFDPEISMMMRELPEGTLELDFSDPTTCRSTLETFAGAMEMDFSGIQVKNEFVESEPDGHKVPVRIYTPEKRKEKSSGLIHVHGGGFVIGSLDSEQATCIKLCKELGIVVISVGYRLAPEHPYPSGLNDCYAALLWASNSADNLLIDRERLGIYGLSAGGGLCAALALLSRDRNGPPICFQYLGIPELDDRLNTPSMQNFSDTPIWNQELSKLSWKYYLGNNYIPGGDNVPIYAAPARANNLGGLPRAYISTMEFDPLRDEGILYALKLMQEGVQTELHSFPGTFHGSHFFSEAKINQRAHEETIRVLKNGLAL